MLQSIILALKWPMCADVPLNHITIKFNTWQVPVRDAIHLEGVLYRSYGGGRVPSTVVQCLLILVGVLEAREQLATPPELEHEHVRERRRSTPTYCTPISFTETILIDLNVKLP